MKWFCWMTLIKNTEPLNWLNVLKFNWDISDQFITDPYLPHHHILIISTSSWRIAVDLPFWNIGKTDPEREKEDKNCSGITGRPADSICNLGLDRTDWPRFILAWRMSSSYFPWLECFLIFSTLEKVWFRYLDVRQLRRLKQRQLPDELKNSITNEEFEKSITYSLDKLQFSFIQESISFVINLLFYIFFLFPYFWKISLHISRQYLGTSNEYVEVRFYSYLLLYSYMK